MKRITFSRQSVGELKPDSPIALWQPELICRVEGEELKLSVVGVGGEILRRHVNAMSGSVSFGGQDTYDGLHWLFRMAVGSAYGCVLLLEKPELELEQLADGRWCVLGLGGAEHEHFDGLVDRLKAGGFEAELITGRSDYPGVAFPIPPGEELGSFDRLVPIITNSNA